MKKRKIYFTDWLTDKLFGKWGDVFCRWFFLFVIAYIIIQVIRFTFFNPNPL